MKPLLLFPDRNYEVGRGLLETRSDLVQDLELIPVFQSMTLNDRFLWEIIPDVVLRPVTETSVINYRQAVLRDCLEYPAVVRKIFEIAASAIEKERTNYIGLFSKYPDSILSRSVDVMKQFMVVLRELRTIADDYKSRFRSAAFINFCELLQRELADDYFDTVNRHLKRLRARGGFRVSAQLTAGNRGQNYTLRRRKESESNWLTRLVLPEFSRQTYHLHPRDESGARALSQLRDRGINHVANALAQSVDHILSFFVALKGEIAFYIGCLNLRSRLGELGSSICFPEALPPEERACKFRGLYDPSLKLTSEARVVGSDLAVDQLELTVITGANRGGKSTFLRSIGTAHLLMQCGMFVPAAEFRSAVCTGLFTHFRREEDTTMASGKLDEELKRMSLMADSLGPNALILFNESFSATNEREGSEIAHQIIRALLENRVRIFFVTHFHELARRFWEKHLPATCFLQPERRPDGERTFRLVQGDPPPTSFAADLYRQVFTEEPVQFQSGYSAIISQS
jgi:DNA mismatch repair ATPase MutS